MAARSALFHAKTSDPETHKEMPPMQPLIQASTPTEGQLLADAILKMKLDTTRGPITLADFLGHQLVLYFYPKDDTPGCTVEGQDFSARHADFLARDTQVVGVSRDSLASHERFIKKYSLSMTLISDSQESLCNAMGVMRDKNMYGKMVRGVERSTFLIGADGKLVKAWRGVKVPGHVDAVLAEIQSRAK
jgi:peroxiredoxin Q/BCP